MRRSAKRIGCETIGDAYARPIVDHLEAHGADDLDLSSLFVYGSGGAILSPSVKESLARLLPTMLVLDAFGASETGGQGSLVGQSDDGAPVFAMDPSNVVIAEDGTLCTPGDGGAAAAAGVTALGGRTPVNPSGGLLSRGHPLGATGLAQCTELVQQLRGTADKRQVPDARLALQHNLGLGGACVVTLYERA